MKIVNMHLLEKVVAERKKKRKKEKRTRLIIGIGIPYPLRAPTIKATVCCNGSDCIQQRRDWHMRNSHRRRYGKRAAAAAAAR
jgi:hypothetical protein